jgi:multiple sugar transport system permease protein
MIRWDRGWRLFLRLALALCITLVFVFPVYWLAAISVKTPNDIYSYPPVWIPSEIHFSSYITLFRDGDAWSVWHSLVTAGVSTVLAMIIGSTAAYSIVRFRTGGDHLAIWIISQRMIPPICVAFPIFLLFVAWKWVDTYTGLILLYTAFNVPYVTWMMRGYIQEIPLELEQSALVDGLSRWAVLRKVVLPMARAGLFATAVFTFIFAWNDFLFALILTKSEVVTYTVKVTGYFGSQSTFWSKIGALSMLGVLPMMVVVGTMQRFIVRGMSMGAVKG